MRHNFGIALAAGILLFVVCGCGYISDGLTDTFGGYKIRDGKVTYHSGLEGMGTRRSWEVAGADAATFDALEDGYARDKSHAYLNGFVIPEADGASFKVYKSPYATDASHVFLGAVKISDAPAAFRIVAELEKGTFATDGVKVFFGNEPFFPDVVDAATFEQLSFVDYFRDKGHVYTTEKVVEGADPATFEVKGTHDGLYARDKNSVFYNATRVEGCDPKTHYVIKGSFHEDAKGVYYGTKKLTDDVKNFEVLKSEYSWDSKHVYWQTDVITDDVDTFRAFPTDGFEAYAKDDHSVFRCGEKVKGVDQVSFAGLNERYAKDKDKVYFSVQCEPTLSTVAGADPTSFTLLKNGDNVDAWDKTNNYNFGTNRGPHNMNK